MGRLTKNSCTHVWSQDDHVSQSISLPVLDFAPGFRASKVATPVFWTVGRGNKQGRSLIGIIASYEVKIQFFQSKKKRVFSNDPEYVLSTGLRAM